MMKHTKRIAESLKMILAAGYEIEFEDDQEIKAMNYETGKSATIRPDGTINTIRADRWSHMMARHAGII